MSQEHIYKCNWTDIHWKTSPVWTRPKQRFLNCGAVVAESKRGEIHKASQNIIVISEDEKPRTSKERIWSALMELCLDRNISQDRKQQLGYLRTCRTLFLTESQQILPFCDFRRFLLEEHLEAARKEGDAELTGPKFIGTRWKTENDVTSKNMLNNDA